MQYNTTVSDVTFVYMRFYICIYTLFSMFPLIWEFVLQIYFLFYIIRFWKISIL